MASPRDFDFRPGGKVPYTRDHPLPDSDEDTEVEYYEHEEETASDFDLDGESNKDEETEDEERTDEEDVSEEEEPTEDDSDTDSDTDNMANVPNVPGFHTPNQTNPLVPFMLAPGHVATNRDHQVICPECPYTPENHFHHGSMSLHFVRRHYAFFLQYYGVPPPLLFSCPHVAACLLGPFTRQSDLNDHLSEKHNLVPLAWRVNLNKQKRRHPDNLIADHVVEATALNALIRRIYAAEASQPAPYASQHGLPLVLFEDDPALITDPRATVAHRKADLAPKLIGLRNTADRMGFLLGGGFGTWEQVAIELEDRVLSLGAPVAGPSTMAAPAPGAEDEEILED